MRRITGIEKIEEARRIAASELMRIRGNTAGRTHTTTCNSKETGSLLYEKIEDETSKAVAYLYDASELNGYFLAIFYPEEWGRYTLPYRGISESELFVPLFLNAKLVKPVTPLTSDEALTEEGFCRVEAFFGSDIADLSTNRQTITSREEAEALTLEQLFEEDEDEEEKRYIALKQPLLPETLSDITGVTIRSAQDYTGALSKLLRTDLRKGERRGAQDYYKFMQAERLIKFALYEFLRTEEYSHLTEVLQGYSSFGLSSKWEKDFSPLYDYERKAQRTAEQYILSCYIGGKSYELTKQSSLRDIAEYTGAPLSLILNSIKNDNIWLF